MLPIPGSGEPVPACDEPGPSASNVELEACYAIGPAEDLISEVSPIPLPSDEKNDGVVQYCQGFQPSGMEGNIFQLFPFQLLPTLDNVVFESHSFHHNECKLFNYVLPKNCVETSNVLCFSLGKDSKMKKILEQVNLPYTDMLFVFK